MTSEDGVVVGNHEVLLDGVRFCTFCYREGRIWVDYSGMEVGPFHTKPSLQKWALRQSTTKGGAVIHPNGGVFWTPRKPLHDVDWSRVSEDDWTEEDCARYAALLSGGRR